MLKVMEVVESVVLQDDLVAGNVFLSGAAAPRHANETQRSQKWADRMTVK